MEKEYKKFGEISFDVNTPDEVCKILANNNHSSKKSRLRLFYGDVVTGRCWMEEHDTIGYIGRSTGINKIPLLIYNNRSIGGGAILDNCIVKITDGNRTLYQHPLFNMPVVTAKDTSVYFDGELYANCKTSEQAIRLADFMSGKRNSK